MSLYDLILLMHVFLEGHCITKSMQFVHMQDHITIEALYPRARKLQFELKIQLSYLESQTGSSGETLQTEARQNLTLLQQLLWQLESMIQAFYRKLHQLKQETESLGATLEQHIFRHNRLAVQLNERESLLNRRHTSFMDGNIARYATQESESLHRSSTMVSDLTSLSHSILGDLTDQRHRLKPI
ncbi:unnamed protein product [Albugo candida]|uniref:Uncharacterized protein n=1 Tax=Albugo candida TaxID=65357 RepID=A0A024GHZ9_9STRA|nr:unnamed protein product [Albugo candida]|eukprot:CCI46508.1 unnamed protein product [Albugo candida]